MRLLEICLCFGTLVLSASALPSDQACAEGSTYKQDCNSCVCRNGAMVCTQRACAPDWFQNRVGGIPDGAQCSPGSSWMMECNWCSCTNTGLAICTLMACLPDFQPDPNEPSCEEGSNWKIDECNRCRCINGKQVCSKRPCGPNGEPIVNPGIQIPEAECDGDGRWRQECNWCRCNEGRGACTRRGCPAAFMERLAGEPDCEGQISFKRDCNSCNCVNGRSVCTTKFCGPVQAPSNVDATVMRASVHLGYGNHEQTCTNGSRWRDDCNWCTCNEMGIGICTLMGCLPGAAEALNEPECEGNSRWKKDCNWCNCNDGKGVCSRRACLPARSPANVPIMRTGGAPEPMCTVGSRWREDCNWCTCSETGVGMCTRKLCRPGDVQKSQNEPECQDNSQWRRDCNWCNCVDGRGVCTLRACIPANRQSPSIGGGNVRGPGAHFGHRDTQPTCTNGSRWRVDCNWCSCTETGIGACTERACILEVPRDEPDCEGNSQWKRDCNWCNCVEGRGVCTKKACIPDLPVHQDVSPLPVDEAQCTPESKWKIDCNSCHCTEGGVGICTKVGCAPGYTPSADEPQCEDGSRWKKDCNWCNCANGKQLCTQIACGISRGRGETCTEGDTWMDDCNSCVCSRGNALCTQKACGYPAPAVLGAECTEGDSWTEDCNNCRCSNGLRLCTRRICIQPTIPLHCSLPPIDPAGPQCAGFQRRWTYDSTIKTCKLIVYGGCGATENLFASESECQSSCSVIARQPMFRQATTPNQERCLLEKDSGPCFAAKTKFFYNEETGSCESFIYGGCGGNRNRFSSLENCMQTCGGISAITDDTPCDKSQCPWMQWAHYIAKGCLPQYDDASCCPTRFSCASNNGTSQSKDKCIYKNKVYEIGDRLEVDHDCSAGCVCAESSLPSGVAEIRCANVECPDLFRPRQPGCRPLYRAGECCSYDNECVDPQNNAEVRTLPTCVWNDKSYKEGDKMYFEEHPCQMCICSGNFSDPFSPGCSKVDCGLDFRYISRYEQGCVPIYFDKRCCPIDWLCPDDSRIVESEAPQNEEEVSEDHRPDQCHIGSKSLKVGEKLEINNCRIDCQCITPPELTCVQFATCEAVTKHQNSRDCPEVKCDTECNPNMNALTGCLSCSCQNKTFTCPEPKCPASCKTGINYETGCPSCKCDCPLDPSGNPPCPMDCAIRTVVDDITGCFKCECDPNNSGNPLSRTDLQSRSNRNCRTGPDGRAPCPLDCAIQRFIDETGCEICRCDPNKPGNQLARPPIPPRSNECRTGPDGRAPCPMDCAVQRFVDQRTGCEVCRCDPNKPGNRFGRPPAPPRTNNNCLRGPDGQAPCPMDCAIERFVDATGCEVCRCDPNDTSNSFAPRPIPPRPNDNCRKGPDGRAPCPMDCAIQRFVDQTGCEVCRCDPTNPGNPFGPPPLPPQSNDNCPKGPDGRPPCPMDCAVERVVDEGTGCEVCRCDPSKPGNPFGLPA